MLARFCPRILELLTAGAVIAKYWGIYLATVFELFGVQVPTSIIVIAVGFSYLQFDNFSPFFAPSQPAIGAAADPWAQSLWSWATGAAPARDGVAGVLSGAALVFFAFIGFDVVPTSAEEVLDPQRTLPRAIFGGLALVTVLYLEEMINIGTLSAFVLVSLGVVALHRGRPDLKPAIGLAIYFAYGRRHSRLGLRLAAVPSAGQTRVTPGSAPAHASARSAVSAPPRHR